MENEAERIENPAEKTNWKPIIAVCIIVPLVVYVIFHFIIGISFIGGSSMEETLHDGQTVFYTRIVREYHKDDIAIARMPNGSLYVKRIVAVGGDEVSLSDGILYVNGIAEDNEAVRGETLPLPDGISFPYKVEEGCYFIMGDNREHSRDSRAFGAVAEDSLGGRLLGY